MCFINFDRLYLKAYLFKSLNKFVEIYKKKKLDLEIALNF